MSFEFIAASVRYRVEHYGRRYNRFMTSRLSDKQSALLTEAVQVADVRVLLMVLVHLTGDSKWLAGPYLPARDVRLIADESAGLPVPVQDEIRTQTVELMRQTAGRPVVSDPGNELMQQMMNVCLGESVPPEYAPMMREQMGFIDRNADIEPPRVTDRWRERPVLIVGTGASGLSLGASLRELGIPFVMVEQASGVGGTWRDNQYPGCSVDTPNHAYSFSFARPYPWSRYFSPRDELLDYLERSATDFGLREHIRFETTVERANWSDEENCWLVQLLTPKGEEQFKATCLVSAIGQLSLPSIPPLNGRDQFAGPVFHSARWPDDLDVTGKHVAVIGTGATSMQVVPAIADTAASVTVYQRTPQWARPIERFHDAIDERAQHLMTDLPYYAAWYRFTMLWRYGDGLLPSLRMDPDWPHPERSLNRANDRHRQQMTAHIEQVLGDRTDLIDKCLPDYPPYGKRILLDNHWYETLLKPNVHLVTAAVKGLDDEGVVDAHGDHRAADVVVLATGFRVGLMAARLNLTGRGGVSLAELWADDNPTAYVGITVPGFPNLFSCQGPTTGLGHGGSAIFTGECQAHYIASCISEMMRTGNSVMDVLQQPHDEYMQRYDAAHAGMIWSHPGMSTYYRNAQGRVYSVMPWRLVDYWEMTRHPERAHYQWGKESSDS
jgi:4-hydroxyacetophenone monooxygenase